MFHYTRDRREKIEGHFERTVKDLLNRAFVNGGFFTLSEVAKYKPSEDESVWDQAKGNKLEVVEVYNKGEWICDVTSGMTRDEMVEKVWKSLEFKKLDKLKKLKESERNANPNSPRT